MIRLNGYQSSPVFYKKGVSPNCTGKSALFVKAKIQYIRKLIQIYKYAFFRCMDRAPDQRGY